MDVVSSQSAVHLPWKFPSEHEVIGTAHAHSLGLPRDYLGSQRPRDAFVASPTVLAAMILSRSAQARRFTCSTAVEDFCENLWLVLKSCPRGEHSLPGFSRTQHAHGLVWEPAKTGKSSRG
jgi:hypothetical protein